METWDFYMQRALELAREAAERNEVPVGALIVCNGEIIAEASNRREADRCVTGHAELLAIEIASRKLKSWRLLDCTLVSTLEPCVMCAGAIVQSRISHLVYGATDPKGGAQALFKVFDSDELNHRVQITTGVLESECSQILKDFFRAKRNGSLHSLDLT
jgi:tRNA(adenine34) deaminase